MTPGYANPSGWRWRLILAGLLLVSPSFANSASAAGIQVEPAQVELTDSIARWQLRVSIEGRDGTRAAQYASSDPKIAAIDSTGLITPHGDGSATITVTHAAGTAQVSVKVSGMKDGRQVDFGVDVLPLLSKFGCNAGGCHGKASGQNGFKLSLFGFDTAFDYDAIVKQARGRRVFPASPDESLLLRKASGRVPHGGGNRLPAESESYALVRRWIEAGALPPQTDAPRVKSLEVLPSEGLLKPGDTQQLSVIAHYSDGSRRDVTRSARYSSNLDPVAIADADGLVKATGETGEAAVMARFMGQVAVYKGIVPYGPALNEIPGFQPINFIDELAAAKWKKLGVLPSATCDDATYLRRVTVDLVGRLPTVEEAKAFLADSAADKRVKLVDRLLQSPEYASFFAMRWGTILRNSNLAGADQAAYAFQGWMKDMIGRNRPYDEFVRGIVAASGEWQDAPAINWYWQMRDDQLHQVTSDTAQVFLGIRLQCARCHHHPYERWGQDDYYGLAGFFTRLGRKSFGQPPPYFASATPTTGEKNPLTDKVPEPKYPDGDLAKFTPEDDPRHGLVDWMAKPENPYFSRVLVNRLWGHFFGRGIVHDIDDMRETNPPSNAALLETLAKEFRDHKFDMKHMIRLMVTSRVYQLSSEPNDSNKNDRQNFARFYGRRLIAEVLHDGVDQATGTKTKFNGVAGSARAIDLPHEGFGSYFLDTFDRPRRVTGCECGRSSGATLAQVLLLANSDDIENKIASGEGRIAKALAAKMPVDAIIDDLYLATLGRHPSPEKLESHLRFVGSDPKEQKALLEDILWTLLNSKEFSFNH